MFFKAQSIKCTINQNCSMNIIEPTDEEKFEQDVTALAELIYDIWNEKQQEVGEDEQLGTN